MVLCQHMAIYGFMSTYGSTKTHKGQNRKTFSLGSQRFTHSAGIKGGSGPGWSDARVTYLSLRIYPKN